MEANAFSASSPILTGQKAALGMRNKMQVGYQLSFDAELLSYIEGFRFPFWL